MTRKRLKCDVLIFSTLFIVVLSSDETKNDSLLGEVFNRDRECPTPSIAEGSVRAVTCKEKVTAFPDFKMIEK
jgi:hypothetical protein